MAKKDELFGRPAEENSELVFEGGSAPVADVKHYVNQPTTEDINPLIAGENPPKDRYQEQVLKGSDAAAKGAVDAHPAENQPG